MAKIKLLKVSELADGAIRLQSQLYVGCGSADFILKDGVLKSWGSGDKGFNFYETDILYELVESEKDMIYQQL